MIEKTEAHPDPRLYAYRPDLADRALEGKVEASRFVRPHFARVISGWRALRRAPDPHAPQDSEVLFGEIVKCFERYDGWAWVQNRRDGYVGYCREEVLTPPDAFASFEMIPPVTHRVSALRTYLYPEPDIKSAPRALLTLEGGVSLRFKEGRWARLIDGMGFIHADHLVPSDHFETDIAGVAEKFLGAPYLWGGKSSVGLDCSGLLQVALHRCGVACPRDTDMQEAAVGTLVDHSGERLVRGDLVFWPGHVGIMLDEARVIHANATDMMVSIWGLRDLVRHIEQSDGHPISSVKRVSVKG